MTDADEEGDYEQRDGRKKYSSRHGEKHIRNARTRSAEDEMLSPSGPRFLPQGRATRKK